ncbi:MAG TPA: FMN-binding protein [Thiotrichales bacterium]|nr:FMN-binding protein [Thiotrichales bacterium]
MNAPLQPAVAPPTPARPMILVLGGIATLSGLLVVLVYHLTLPRIEANHRAAVEAAVFAVLPGAACRQSLWLDEAGLHHQPVKGGREFHAVFDGDGRLLGIAAEGVAQGYAGPVRLIWGWRPDCRCIVGMRIVGMTETPGLGDKVASDEAFLANFAALEARPTADGLEHPIVTVRHGRKQQPWEIDAISGATISSRAVGEAIARSAETLLPRVAGLLEKLTVEEEG